MKTLAALTLTAAVIFTTTPVQANPATDALQQLATNQLAELKITVAEQARQAMEKTAAEVRQLLLAEPQVAKQSDAVVKTESKPAAE